MKYSILSLSIFVIFFTIVRADIEIAKGQCEDLGFKPGTEKYADCVMKLLPKKDTKKKQLNADKATSKIDKNTKKVGEDNSNLLKFDEATYVGEVKKGKAYGIGVITFSDGSKYEGKVSKNRIHGKGIYTDSQGNVFEGKFRRNKFIDKIDKKIRKIITLDVYKGIEFSYQIKGSGAANSRWFEAEMIYLHRKMLKNNININDIDNNSELLLEYVKYVLTSKGKRDMEKAISEAGDSGGDGGGDGGGGCG